MQSTKFSFEDTAVAFKTKSNYQLKKSLWLFATMNKSWLVAVGTFLLKMSIKLKLPVKGLIKATIFEQFCGGENLAECNKTIANLANQNIGTILDYSVEGEDDELAFEQTFAELIKNIDKARNETSIPFAVFKVTGIGNAQYIEKLQKNEPLTAEEQQGIEAAKKRMFALGQKAFDNKVKLFVDAEESWIQDIIDDWAHQLMELYNKEEAIIFNTYQLYRSDVLKLLTKITEKAAISNFKVGAKLVRGAYMEKERERAESENRPSPIQPNKDKTDRDYNIAIDLCLKYNVSICLGTHNEYSCYYLAHRMKEMDIKPNDNRYYFAQLLGMSDNISMVLAANGYNVAKYVPYGPIEAVVPYLVRRAKENTAMAGQSSREYSLVKKEVDRRKITTILD